MICKDIKRRPLHVLRGIKGDDSLLRPNQKMSFLKVCLIGKFTELSHIIFNGQLTLTEVHETILRIHG